MVREAAATCLLHSPSVRLRVLGSSGTYPTPGGPCSGYLVEAGATRVMLDAGPGTVAALQQALPGLDIDGLVITHAHPDHCSDVFHLFNLLRFGPVPRQGLAAFAPDPSRCNQSVAWTRVPSASA